MNSDYRFAVLPARGFGYVVYDFLLRKQHRRRFGTIERALLHIEEFRSFIG